MSVLPRAAAGGWLEYTIINRQNRGIGRRQLLKMALFAGGAAVASRFVSPLGKAGATDTPDDGYRRTGLWQSVERYLSVHEPDDNWREGCWRFLSYPALFEGAAAAAIFAIHLGDISGQSRVAIVSNDSGIVLLSEGG